MSRTTNLRRASALMAAFSTGAALLAAVAPAAADKRSSDQDRQRLVAAAHALEQAPLRATLADEREWALAWLAEAPDITVTVCANKLAPIVKAKYKFGGEIIVQDMLAMGAFAIEHPEAASDPAAQQIAGLDGALNAYSSILRDDPAAKAKALQGLLDMRSRGELGAFVRKAWSRCAPKK